jgi:NAD(P)H-dependent FMN reductase
VARWFEQFAAEHGAFDVELVDLLDVNLPVFDEPHHPRLQKYEHQHTIRWSQIIARGDAYVVVTPEYNYFTPPSLVNAFDYLSAEWAYKPLGFVSYGGISGGLRAMQQTRLLANALKLVPIVEQVAIPAFTDFIDAEGTFNASPQHEHAGGTMLNELLRWESALSLLRN